MEKFISPPETLQKIGLQPGAIVADFGAGAGHYTLPAARMVGASGAVYALDVQKDLLEKITGAAKQEGLQNVHVIWADLEKKSTLPEGAADLVILSNTLFQVAFAARVAVLREAYRVLKPGGRLALIEWHDTSPLGPGALQRLSPVEARRLALTEGFREEKNLPAGAHHYGIVFEKPSR